jgi:hypothetical protein
MKTFLNTIKYDYLQRTRSYAFLITLCFSLAFAYTLIPAPDANYSTVQIGGYTGNYTSNWIAYVSAIMTSTFLSLIGLYLVNGSIKTDVDTKVGQIIAVTSISNFNYLLSKVFSNFLVLFSIAFLIFCMSIGLFFKYNQGYSFDLMVFIKAYGLLVLPALFFISMIAVLIEVFIGKYTALQNVVIFMIFMLLLGTSKLNKGNYNFDVITGKVITVQMENQVNKLAKSNNNKTLNIGFTNVMYDTKKFDFKPEPFSIDFIISRLLWVLLGIGIVAGIAPLFHRFNVKERKFKKIKTTLTGNKIEALLNNEINVKNLIKTSTNYSILPLIKTELLLLFRNGKKGMWFLNIIGMILLLVVPVKVAHQFILPVLWFLQVGRLSTLSTKELTNNVHYFAYSSYKPISRLLLSKFISGSVLTFALAFPLLLKLVFIANFTAVLAIILGGMFIVLLAITFGIVSKSKKLFEVLFFFIAYANINQVPFLDYYGGVSSSSLYNIKLLSFAIILGLISVFVRKMEIERN